MALFTVEEANALLPRLKPLVGELMALRQRILERHPHLEHILEETWRANGGSRIASEVAADMQRIRELVKKINSYGCLLKDVNTGLIDFPAEINGREVYLCWQWGEEEVAWLHDLEAGFAGRQPLR